jgi:Domain of unknown function (DUF1840)
MLVRFDSKVGTITMFGDVAKKLLRTMGQSGSVPGAILAPDIPNAVEKLRAAVSTEPEKQPARDANDDSEPVVNLRQRAFPLIELLERAARERAEVMWEEERRGTF